jgi:hypothetical protein
MTGPEEWLEGRCVESSGAFIAPIDPEARRLEIETLARWEKALREMEARLKRWKGEEPAC